MTKRRKWEVPLGRRPKALTPEDIKRDMVFRALDPKLEGRRVRVLNVSKRGRVFCLVWQKGEGSPSGKRYMTLPVGVLCRRTAKGYAYVCTRKRV